MNLRDYQNLLGFSSSGLVMSNECAHVEFRAIYSSSSFGEIMAATHAATRENGNCQPLKRQKQEPLNTVTVVLGSQWGDEGKGKIVDLLATEADVVCRCQVCWFGYIILGGNVLQKSCMLSWRTRSLSNGVKP